MKYLIRVCPLRLNIFLKTLPNLLVKENFFCLAMLFLIALNAMRSEIVALIHDLDLVPRNFEARDFYQILENEQMRRNRIECDLRALSNRYHKRNKDVLAPYGYHVSGTLEF